MPNHDSMLARLTVPRRRWSISAPVIILLAALAMFAVGYWRDSSPTDPPATQEIAIGQLTASPVQTPSTVQSGMNPELIPEIQGQLPAISAPLTGYVSYYRQEVEYGDTILYRFSGWTTETWQRTGPDNNDQKLVVATIDGKEIGRYLQSGDKWQIDADGSIESGSGEPTSVPPYLTSQPLLTRTDLEKPIAEFDRGHVEKIQEDNAYTVKFVFTNEKTMEEARSAEQLLGEDLVSMVTTVRFQDDDEVASLIWMEWVSASGDTFLMYETRTIAYDELPYDELDEALFSFEQFELPNTTPLPTSSPEFKLVTPPEGALPFGFRMTTHETLSHGEERAIFVGNKTHVIELYILGKGFLSMPRDEFESAELPFGSIYWDSFEDNGGPYRAFWSGNDISISLSTLTPELWTVDDLLEFATVLMAYQ